MHGQTDQLFDNSLLYRFSHIEWVVILFVIATMFFKVIAMATTNAAGGVGGTFAPSLFVGAFTGASLALVCNALFGWSVPIASFTLVGMAGVMTGVMKAPLTSIFLIAELSNGNGTERPGAVYLAAVLAAHAQKGLPAFGIYGHDVQDLEDNTIPADVTEKILRWARAAVAVAQMRGESYLSIGSQCMGIAGSIVDQDFFQEYLRSCASRYDSRYGRYALGRY